jgi:putative endonuclease
MAYMHETGKKGEALAKEFLINTGYRILETNWQSNHQEIDIIAAKNDLVVIVEVKSRRSACFGNPESSVTRLKQRMLIKAANHYLALHRLNHEVRFDIIAIMFLAGDHQINHIENAFYPVT